VTRIVSRQHALARGVSDSELQRYCRTRAWRRLCPGKFVSSTEFDALSPTDKHRIVAEAVLSTSQSPDSVLSHISAVVLHGLDVYNADLRKVHITRNRSGGGRSSSTRKVHTSTYTESEVTEVDGVRVTSLARTVADVARSLPFEEAVCIADCAARTRGVTRDQIEAVLDSCANHPDNRRARRVAEFMDARSESVGESRCRVVLHELGYAPRPQVLLSDAAGVFARLDFEIEDISTVVEFDGRIKYGKLVPEGHSASDVLWEEKRREDRIRATGRQVVRLTWADLEHPHRIRALLVAAAARAAASPPPTGTTRET